MAAQPEVVAGDQVAAGSSIIMSGSAPPDLMFWFDPERSMSPLETVGEVIEGEVRVLLVRVSVVALPTRVSVEVGKVSVPVLEMLEITGVVRVLLVKVWVSVVPTISPVGTVFPDDSIAVPPEFTRRSCEAVRPVISKFVVRILLDKLLSET